MKKVSFSSKPRSEESVRSPDQWVATRAAESERTKRLTIDVPFELHRRMKVQCAVRGEQMADVVRKLLEEYFPKEYQESDPMTERPADA